MIRHYVAAFRSAPPRCRFADKGNLLYAKASLIADHGAGTALALQAMADGNARWLALNCRRTCPQLHAAFRTIVNLRSSASFTVITLRICCTTRRKAPHLGEVLPSVSGSLT
jgi:hypothetical protein